MIKCCPEFESDVEISVCENCFYVSKKSHKCIFCGSDMPDNSGIVWQCVPWIDEDGSVIEWDEI
jgi:hypothetical protein